MFRLEPLTCLAFLSGVIEKVALGISVAVLPYRHPLYTARVAHPRETPQRVRAVLKRLWKTAGKIDEMIRAAKVLAAKILSDEN